MTTLTAELKSKIERRSKRAWRRRRDGSTKSISRISDVTDDELKYRLPYSPDYYGKEKVRVVRGPDGAIEVDPKTKGLIDCLAKSDLEKVKRHGGTVRAYTTTKADAQAGRVGILAKATLAIGQDFVLKSGIELKSRQQCIDSVVPGDRVFSVEFQADGIDNHTLD